tara:strand:+ start:313 stop:477 length:165 start_codon:yes stop_codon:yes gene_type:complete
MQEYIDFIGSVGFPIAMCGYLMIRFEKRLMLNTEVTNELINYMKGDGKCQMKKK